MTPLITDAERAQLIANGQDLADGDILALVPVVRLFTLDAHDTSATRDA